MVRAFFLVLIMNPSGDPAMTTIPISYETRIACEEAGIKWLKDMPRSNDFYCVYHETRKDLK